MVVHRSVLDFIGDTPLVELSRFDTGPCRLFVKLENQNPGGSIKDRIGLSMIEAAERDGRISPGGTLVEATAGNTGLGLALVAAQKGYRLILVIPDKMSQEKILHLKALGAEVRITRSDVGKGHPDYYQDMAERIARETPGAFYVNQFANPANPLAHETTTGPEIWEQMGHDVDAVVCRRRLRRHAHRARRASSPASRPRSRWCWPIPSGSILAPTSRDRTASSRPARGWWRASARISFRRLRPRRACAAPITIADAESFADRARAAAPRGHPRPAPRPARCWPRALRYCREQTAAEARRDPRLRQRQQVPLQDVQRLSGCWIRACSQRDALGDLRDLIARRHAEGGVGHRQPRRTRWPPLIAACSSTTSRSCR